MWVSQPEVMSIEEHPHFLSVWQWPGQGRDVCQVCLTTSKWNAFCAFNKYEQNSLLGEYIHIQTTGTYTTDRLQTSHQPQATDRWKVWWEVESSNFGLLLVKLIPGEVICFLSLMQHQCIWMPLKLTLMCLTDTYWCSCVVIWEMFNVFNQHTFRPFQFYFSFCYSQQKIFYSRYL